MNGEPKDLNPEEKALRYRRVAMFLFSLIFTYRKTKIRSLRSEMLGTTEWIWHLVYRVLCYLTRRIASLVGASC